MRTDEAILVFAIMGGALLVCAYGWWLAERNYRKEREHSKELRTKLFWLEPVDENGNYQVSFPDGWIGTAIRIDPREARESVFDHQKESQLGEKL